VFPSLGEQIRSVVCARGQRVVAAADLGHFQQLGPAGFGSGGGGGCGPGLDL